MHKQLSFAYLILSCICRRTIKTLLERTTSAKIKITTARATDKPRIVFAAARMFSNFLEERLYITNFFFLAPFEPKKNRGFLIARNSNFLPCLRLDVSSNGDRRKLWCKTPRYLEVILVARPKTN